MDSESIRHMVEETGAYEQVKLQDIPDIDLYMDQVITFIERKLAHLKSSDADKLLTKTMINNYTKAGLIKAPVKKKYSRRQMATLLMIYEAKQILSMQHIGMMLNTLNPGPGGLDNGEDLFETVYDLSLDITDSGGCGLEETCLQQMESIQQSCQAIGEERREKVEWFLMANSLLARAAREKRLAEKIIERYLDGASNSRA